MLVSWTSYEAAIAVNVDADRPGTMCGLLLPEATVCDGEGPLAWHSKRQAGSTREYLGVAQAQNC